MVGAKKKRKASSSLPQLKVGGIYHADIHSGTGRRGHFVIISEILGPGQVRVHVCTSSETAAGYGSISVPGLLGPEMTYILLRSEIIDPAKITASRHMVIDAGLAKSLGIDL